jgi:hypothetical protein
MRWRAFTLTLVLAALGLAATAHAAPLAGVKVATCQSGDQSTDRRATFVGQMRGVPGAVQLRMRFLLEERYGGNRFTRVQAQELRGWRKSRSRVQSYSYSQGVAGLLAGESYRVQVQFRWIDSDGKTILRARRYSGVCDQPGQLPNLKVLGITARPGVVGGTEAYTVSVVNGGLATAERVAVQLVIDGATPDTTTVESLAPGEIRALHFTGPACRHRVRVVADPKDTIHEALERDNSSAGRCPPQG